ncbi:MAG: hypothetical protein EXR70_15020 [Deltaproteobacteria bacterium]|nr:hypothetical protein [Deltaproteobacteria bacterium]
MFQRIKRFTLATILMSLLLAACAGSRDETISGVAIPVPSAMKKSTDKPVEISFLGFGVGQATFRGDMESEKLVEFYKTEMAARGWQTSMNLVSGGAMLAYSKDAKTVMIGIGKQDNQSVLSLTVGSIGK